ncbi:ATPase domain-containing protein [Calothrix sp. 336/3]|uniref:ATPase domain-containing protein n=1 Tax=Calothrix sp. 336/3 TaxID=1337936 RepID=UPI0004E3B667|nr:ATPase domain-containing protein [Calothrix sp. 336/3]AKG20070.1 recombinase RecA [Calothrix sp. 336/3]
MINPRRQPLGKLPTSIPGLDGVLSGGIPELSINIITGPPGAGKTIFTQQILYSNATPERNALYLVTLSEPSVKLLHYLQRFDFFDAEKVNTAVTYLDIGEVIREKGLEDAIAVIVKHVQDYKPALVAIDSFKAIHDMAKDPVEVRKFGYDLSVRLTTWGVTAFLIGEYTQEEIEKEPIFAIADGIIRLHNHPQGLHYQRYIDVLKLRGENYFTGLHPFNISDTGLTVYPRIKFLGDLGDIQLHSQRATTGVTTLDDMLDGGIPRGSATMVAGGAGTGKTLLGLHLITAGIAQGEPGVIVTFQENPHQLREIARSFGWDLAAMEEQELLVHLYSSPVEIQPDVHAAHVKEMVQRIGAKRVLLDSLKDIEIATPDKVRFKDYIYALVNQFKLQGVTTLLTNEIPEMFGPFQLSEYGVSFVVDNVILLRYVELAGRMGRAINIMKVRGSQHSKEIRYFEINNEGIQIDTVVEAQTGVLTGIPILKDRRNNWQYLPIKAKYVIEALEQKGRAELEELVSLTGLSAEDLIKELEELREQGMVIHTQIADKSYYKRTLI